MAIKRDKMGRFVKGHKSPDTWLEVVSEKLKGNKHAAGSSHRKGMSLEEEYGPKRAEEIRKKISENARWKGKVPPNLREAQSHSPVSKKGKENINWKDNVQDEYGYDFTLTLKEKVWKRDSGRCQICEKGNEEAWDGEFVVHHIDWDKKNNDLENLILLCRSCHMKVHHNSISLTTVAV